MAAQCWPFVSSSVYYGYVQTPAPAGKAAHHQDQPQPQLNGSDEHRRPMHHCSGAGMMDVDAESCADKRQQQYQAIVAAEAQKQRARKRNFEALPQDFDYEPYVVPRFKRFREGNWLWASSDEHGLAQMYHEPLLRLSPAADCDMACQPTTGNLKLQSAVQARTSNASRCQELEDMLLMTHGCSSYHHYRHTQLFSQPGDSEEAEF